MSNFFMLVDKAFVEYGPYAISHDIDQVIFAWHYFS